MADEQQFRLAIDAKGYCWRVFADGTWSMARVNPDNSPVPQPVTFYTPYIDAEAQNPAQPEQILRDCLDALWKAEAQCSTIRRVERAIQELEGWERARAIEDAVEREREAAVAYWTSPHEPEQGFAAREWDHRRRALYDLVLKGNRVES